MIKGLISVEVDPFLGPKSVESILNSIGQRVQIGKISPIAKVKSAGANQNELIYTLFDFTDESTIENLMLDLLEIEQVYLQQNPKRKVVIKILCCGDKVSVNPNLLLPHPSLVQSPHLLRAAQEVDSNYFHPILQATLKQCQADNNCDIEFIGLASSKQIYKRENN